MNEKCRAFVLMATVAAMAFPIWAKPKNDRTDKANWEPVQPVTVGQTKLQPGSYMLRAQESGKTLEVMRDGKIVAQVPCHWIELSKKAASTQVDTTANKMTQVEFAGRTEALQIG